jgi:hypothetical protein
MLRFGFYVVAALVIIHGLVHLMGFVAYWPLREVTELPYKTTLLGGRWDIGLSGMRLFSLVWLVTAVTFIVSAIALMTGKAWWLPLMGTAVLLSLVICVLDWQNAFRGAILDLVILVPVLLAWGLHIQPQPFPAYPEPTAELITVPLPAGLPAPVARYYRTITSASLNTSVGEQIPVIETAVITARGTVRFAEITFPARLRFTHDAGQGYRHYIEATFFGKPLLKVNETYLDGQARMALPVGVIENEPKVDMAANLGLWGESAWLPSIYLTDPRVRWQAVDETTARLIVPFGEEEDSFTVFFDGETGLIRRMEALRYREATDTEKILWWFEPLGWAEFQGILVPSPGTVTWADEGMPWLIIELEDVAYNVDIAAYIGAVGP